VHVATTLLAQVDAAIGGKTGVNIPEGKNLVGAFWQPAAVLCDTEVLESLPPREYQSGLGELAKYSFLGAEGLADLPLAERVARCVEIKAAVVAADEREGGGRALLNYGHTLAHALEAFGLTNGWDLRHGEAVGIGLIFAALLARRLGRIDDERVTDHRRVVQCYGLPDDLPPDADVDRLIDLMARDKKATTGFTFVLDGARGVEVVRDVQRSDVRETLLGMAQGASSPR
jgi:5-deoxy-5-amino-3-dehydroquinate synthase